MTPLIRKTMAQKTDIYLTPEFKDYAGKNPNLDIDGLRTVSLINGVGILFLITFFSLVFYFGKKFLQVGNVTSSQESKEGVSRVFIALAAVALIFSMFGTLGVLNGDLSLPSLGGKTSQTTATTLDQPIQKEADAGGSTVVQGGSELLTQMTSTESEKRAVLAYQKITINADPCTKINQTGCTSVGGMSEQTLAMLKDLKLACKCEMIITGGTEWWLHSATTKHRPGNVTAVDLRLSDDLSTFINTTRTLFKPGMASNNCYATYSWRGFYFCDEKPGKGPRHWHIQPF